MTSLPILIPPETLDSMVVVLDLVRSGRARTRPDLVQLGALGRATVAQRVTQLLAIGLLEESDTVASTGGRPARELRFRSELGLIAAVELGATTAFIGVADLCGTMLASRRELISNTDGPDAVLSQVESVLDKFVAEHSTDGRHVWAVGVGLTSPVEYTTGRPMSPPLPGWEGYPVRDRFAKRYCAPVWVDNEVNLMALAELRRASDDQLHRNLLFLKIGTGIGAGLIFDGTLYRGSQGSAGDVGHMEVTSDPSAVCRCGKTGCVVAVAGGEALGRLATRYARDGDSNFLARRLSGQNAGALEAADLAAAATYGDTVAVAALIQAGKNIGRMLSTVINLFNPALVVVGGGVAGSGDLLLAAIRNTVYERSLPLATRDLRIELSAVGQEAGLFGAAALAIDELFSRRRLPLWLKSGSPAARPNLVQDAA